MPARLFVRELQARGLDCSAALSAAELTAEMLLGARAELPLSQCLRLVSELRRLAPGDDVAVLAGTRAELADLDLAGLYVRSRPSAREAIEFHRQNPDLFESAAMVDIYPTEHALVVALVPRPQSPAQTALAECVLAAALTLARAMGGPMTPIETRFRHPRPASDCAHVRVFGALGFACEVDALLLPLELLDRPFPHSDEAVGEILQPHLARQLEATRAARADLATRVLREIRQQLSQGATSSESLAKCLRVSPRTLRRELSLRDTSYTMLLTQARRELAMQYALQAPRRAGPEIARLLGYVDAHTFYRAFKRWTGVSLSAYRKQSTPPPTAGIDREISDR